ncbi:hypothetical protein GQ53DRAFT_832790 [Thozetella sp. PMI_491]|nr:hypothetical protein GQ53DRAFT_832790 [Thozetella sp. PMI_491]
MAAFIVAFSAVFGTAEAIRHTQSEARKKEHRTRKNNMIVHCRKSSVFSNAIEGKHIVLSGDKLYVDTGRDYDKSFGHPFAGYYLPYPDTQYSGLVSTICDEPPIMNWIYVERETYAVKFGTRPYAQPNLTGPFDCTRQDRRLTFGGWEGFFVVKEDDFWALYFDVDGDGLAGKVADGVPKLEVNLLRIEMPVKLQKKEEEAKAEADTSHGAKADTKADAGQDELESPEVD